MAPDKRDLPKHPIEHVDMQRDDVRSFVESMGSMAFQAQNHRAATIDGAKLRDQDSAIVLCLARSLVSAAS